MGLQALANLGLGASIFLALLAEGTLISAADVRYLFGKPGQLLRAVLALNVASPLITVLVCRTFALHPAVTVALATLASAPVGGLFPQAMLALVPNGRSAYAHGVFFASTLLSVLLTPLNVEAFNALYGGDVHVAPLSVAEVSVGAMLLPLGLGLLLGRTWPGVGRWRPMVQRVSSWLLLASLFCLVPVAWPSLGAIVRQGTLLALLLLTALSLGIGHVLGGPNEDSRTMLGFATVSRHPGVAISVAALTQQPLAPVGVLLAVLVNQFAVIPYKRWRKRLHATQAPLPAPPAA